MVFVREMSVGVWGSEGVGVFVVTIQKLAERAAGRARWGGEKDRENKNKKTGEFSHLF